MSSADQLSDPTASTPSILAEMLTQGHSSGDAAAMARLLHKLAEVFTLAQKYPLADREPHQPSHRHKLDSRLAEYATDLHAAGLTSLAYRLRQDARAVTETFVGMRRIATLLERLRAHSETETYLASAGLADEFDACLELTFALLATYDADAVLDAPSIAEAARGGGSVDPLAIAFFQEFNEARIRRRARRPSKGS